MDYYRRLSSLVLEDILLLGVILFSSGCDSQSLMSLNQNLDENVMSSGSTQNAAAVVDLQGSLFLQWIPSSPSFLSGSNFLLFHSQFPSRIDLEWPTTNSLTGSVWIADDALSDPNPISSQVWFLDPFLQYRFLPFSDQDPFSNQQFLVHLPPWRTTFELRDNQYISFREAILYEAYVQAFPFPPRLFKSLLPQDRLQLILPPRDALRTLNGQLWVDPAIGLTYPDLEVSAYYQGNRISTLGKTDASGQFSLQLWQDQPLSPLKFKVSAPSSLQLPSLFVERRFSDIESLTDPDSLDLDTILTYPFLGSMRPLSIQFASQTQGNFQIYIQQKWSTDKGDVHFNHTYFHQGDEERQIDLYNQPTLLFIHSHANQIERTMRLELPQSSSSRLVIQPQFKSAVRGLVQTKQNQGVESQIDAYQLTWPWVDAHQLPLGQYSTLSDEEGTFSLNLDPGKYALVLQPLDPLLSRKVIVIEVGTEASILLNPNDLIVSSTQSFLIDLSFPTVDPLTTTVDLTSLSYTLKLGCRLILNPLDSVVHWIPFLSKHTDQRQLQLDFDPNQVCPVLSEDSP